MVGARLGEDGFHTRHGKHGRREATSRVCVSGGEKEVQEETSFVFQHQQRERKDASLLEKAKARTQLTGGPEGLEWVSIRAADEVVWMLLKEGGVSEKGGIIFSMFSPFYLLLFLGRSKLFLETLQNKLLITAVRMAETDRMNTNIRASIKSAIGFARLLAMRKELFGFCSKRGLLQVHILSCLCCINIYIFLKKTIMVTRSPCEN